MGKSNKIKALLSIKGLKNSSYAEALGLARQQALTTKYARESFTSDDLIVLAELTATRLAFIDKETGEPVISFDSEDLKKDA